MLSLVCINSVQLIHLKSLAHRYELTIRGVLLMIIIIGKYFTKYVVKVIMQKIINAQDFTMICAGKMFYSQMIQSHCPTGFPTLIVIKLWVSTPDLKVNQYVYRADGHFLAYCSKLGYYNNNF